MSPKKELKIKGGKYFISDVDVSSIVNAKTPDFITVMGDVGDKEYHDYFGLRNDRWDRVTGVTSVLDMVGDKRQLIQWAANMAVAELGWVKANKDEPAAEYKLRLNASIQEFLTKLQAMEFKDVVKLINDARLAHSRFMKKTANLGKQVHADIETLIKMAITLNKGVIPQSIVSNEQVQHFINWAVKNNVVFKTSELALFSKKYWVAGTCDIVMEVDGDLYVGDIKTTNGIYGRAYFAQCAAYRMMLQENWPGNYDFKGSILINIKRDGTFEPEDDIHLSPYYSEDLKFFEAALVIYRQEMNLYES